MVDKVEYFCECCRTSVEFSKLPIQCDSCFYWFHGKCEKLTKKEWNQLGCSNLTWNCKACTKEIFPYFNLSDDELLECIMDLTSDIKELCDKCLSLEKNVIRYSYENLNNSDEISKYITHDKLCSMSHEIQNSLSIIHFNCRSIKRNFDDIECLLHRCNVEFKIICLSETWMTESDDYDNFKLNGYMVHYMNRLYKRGGGTALFVKDTIKQKCIQELSYSVENCFDVVTVEIKESNGKFIYVSCLYRPPNVRMDSFMENYTTFLQKLGNKRVFICGDFNIDLIKSQQNNDTNNFLDMIYSYGQHPLITLPTRITNKSSSAIDHIFTNILNVNIKRTVISRCITRGLYTDFTYKTPGCGLYTGAGNTPISFTK